MRILFKIHCNLRSIKGDCVCLQRMNTRVPNTESGTPMEMCRRREQQLNIYDRFVKTDLRSKCNYKASITIHVVGSVSILVDYQCV